MAIKQDIKMSVVKGTNRTHLAAQLTCAYCALIASGVSHDDADDLVMRTFSGMDSLLKRMCEKGQTHRQ